ncbi:ClpS-like protein [Violaceomyces palustris]|uniref:ClpS-like protein n=1 Tax=Violaceomyces palustris TaxID=1673888 RepID=A0ACD0P3H6_9BASI|nr:ClpS-like protein [Violaceomyces palustris]
MTKTLIRNLLRLQPFNSSSTLTRSSPLLLLPFRNFSTSKPVREDVGSSTTDPKILNIVDQVEKLTLLEASQLVSALKTRLNITEMAMPAMVGSGSVGTSNATAGETNKEEEQEKPKEKTIFNLKLTGLKDATAKAKVIREVKAINTNMNLVEAKKFVESAPQVLKEGINKEEAEKLKKAIEAAGGTVELE